MYLEKLRLENIKILADQDFNFTRSDGSSRLWTVILGDNGLCKSTILQAIALAASGANVGSSLARDAQLYRRVDSTAGARIEAHFTTPDPKRPDLWPVMPQLFKKSESLKVVLEIDRRRHTFVPSSNGIRLIDDVRSYRTPGWLVVGYGVGRFLPRPGEVALPQDYVRDRVEGLFDVRHKMLGTDFYGALRERKQAGKYSKALRDALLAANELGDKLLPMLDAIELRGRKGVQTLSTLLESRRFAVKVGRRVMKLPVTSLSDGYQSTIAWIADLLGHMFLDGEGDVEPEAMEGLVLLDEVDLHLHPTWQRRLVPILKKVFPKLQFIVTTHSPLVLTGFEREEIIRLRLVNGLVEQDPAEIEPGIMDASELLTSYFNVPRAGRPELVDKERRYLELKAVDTRSRVEEHELKELAQELQRYWEGSSGSDEE